MDLDQEIDWEMEQEVEREGERLEIGGGEEEDEEGMAVGGLGKRKYGFNEQFSGAFDGLQVEVGRRKGKAKKENLF